jgi:alpha-L-rhamnosidase
VNWNAEWIWQRGARETDNFYLLARKEIALDRIPAGAKIFVTAGSIYKLYINGTYIGRGPNPSDHSYYYYDIYDVSSHLKPGKNAIAAICYNYGPKAHGIIHQNFAPGGFLLEMQDGSGKPIAKTDRTWKVLPAPQWDQAAPLNNNMFGDFKEFYDARKEIPGWREAGFDDAKWNEPDVQGKPPMAPFNLVEREIPFLGGPRLYPVATTWDSASINYQWQNDWEFYGETNLIDGKATQPGVKPLEAQRTHDDYAPGVLLDFGTLVTGYPEISIKDCDGGVIEVLYGENTYLTRIERFTLRPGSQVLQSFNRRTFRYMKLLFVETPKKILIDRVSIDLNTYPVKYEGQFNCSDPLLNKIWDVGRYTIQMSMLDHFVDCPWRERTIYGGDLYAETLIAAYAFGDGRLAAKTIRQMFAIQYAEGAVPVMGPYKDDTGFYASWTAFTGLALLDHVRLSNDKKIVADLWPKFQKMLEWTANEVETNNPHMIGAPSGGGGFEKWKTAPKVTFPAWSNLPFLPLLRDGAELARREGHTAVAERCEKAAAMMTEAIRTHLVDADGVLRNYPPGSDPGQPALINNAYLVWCGALSPADRYKTLAAMNSAKLGNDGNPFHGLFIVDSFFAAGQTQQALDYIRSYWGDMLRRGATTFWEHFSFDWSEAGDVGRGGSHCHGWSAGPTYLLPLRVLGVEATERGFTKVRIAPQPGDLTWAEGKVPTPLGPISVKWTKAGQKFSLELTLPPGCIGEVVLPPPGLHATLFVDGERSAEKFHPLARPTVQVDSGEHRLVVERLGYSLRGQ